MRPVHQDIQQPIQDPITGAEPNDPTTLVGALAQFYAAFNSRDLALMAANWSHGDVAMDNPVGGIARGWDAIRSVYERIFDSDARVSVEFYDYTLHESAELGYAVGRERGSLTRGGKELRLAIRTTRVFRREDGVWRQVHHHGSMDDAERLARYQSMVRGDAE